MSTSQAAFELDGSKSYPMIVNSAEHTRLNAQSSGFNEMMLGRISLAPLQKPARILDVGCGTGMQTRLLAELYPDATVIGVDPNPVPDVQTKPKNAEFILGQIEDVVNGQHELLLQPASFDLIYGRALYLWVKNWRAHIAMLSGLLRPGGWLEFQEFNAYRAYDADERVISDNWRFSVVFKRDGEERGFNTEIADELPDLCRQMGFEAVLATPYPLPFRSDWTARPETARIGKCFQWEVPVFLRMLSERAAQPEQGEDPEEVYEEAMDRLVRGPVGTHFRFTVTIARKPA